MNILKFNYLLTKHIGINNMEKYISISELINIVKESEKNEKILVENGLTKDEVIKRLVNELEYKTQPKGKSRGFYISYIYEIVSQTEDKICPISLKIESKRTLRGCHLLGIMIDEDFLYVVNANSQKLSTNELCDADIKKIFNYLVDSK